MRIGIDARLGHRQGVGRVIAEIIDGVSVLAPQHEYVVFVKAGKSDALIQRLKVRENIRWIEVSGIPFRLREHVEMIRSLRREALDLYHVTYDFGTPLHLPCKMILTVHDAWFERETFFRSDWTRRYFQAMTRRGLKRAGRVVAVSHFVREKILHHCPWMRKDEGKIRVVHNGVGEEFSPASVRPAPLWETWGVDRYILYLGVLAKNKNIFRLLEAYAELVRRQPQSPPLVLGGKREPSLADPIPVAQRLGIGQRVHFLGYVPQEALPDLYRGAELFVLPSLHEGFGIPVLEAMASGIPVVASRISAIPEVAAEAAVLVDPTRPEEIARGMERVLLDSRLREGLVARGIERARHFSWKKGAQQVLSLYRELHEED